MIKVIRVRDYEEMSDKAFEIMHDLVSTDPHAVLGLATGSSPVGLYQRMVKDHRENGTSYQDVITYNLDEYVGLPKSHPESYYSFMHRNLFDGIDVKEENIHIPSSEGDLAQDCDDYNAALAEHTIDLQVLGIGSDGHIGFNEPGTPFDSVTHIVDLKESTIKDNARFFDNDVTKVPTQAITMGISNVMAAKRIMLLASGENKAPAIQATVMGVVTENVPASVLQNHPDVVLIVDDAAASSLLKEKY
jgi:glucosamine-6-phosphate deaminase